MSKRLRELQSKKAGLVAEAKSITQLADAEERELSADEAAKFSAVENKITGLNAAIDREIKFIGEESDSPVAESYTPRVSVRDNLEDDPKRGFKHFGEVAVAVRQASVKGVVDPRLKIGAAAPGAPMNEGTGEDGGFAIPPEFSREIWRVSIGEGSLLPMTQNTEIGGNSMVFPKDESTPWGGTGVQVYWEKEAKAARESAPKLGTSILRLNKMMALVPVTDELVEDGFAVGSYLMPLVSERIQWKTNEAILFGSGNGQPLGVMKSNAIIEVDKETGQTAATINQPNISNMRSRLKTGELKNAIWLGNPDILPALEAMTLGNVPIFLPPGNGVHADYDGTLNGRPLVLSEHASGLGAKSDLSLLALSGYRTITKAGGIETATSMHLYFDAAATAFRTIFRLDGQPIISAPIQPPAGKGSKTRSYFVTLGARG